MRYEVHLTSSSFTNRHQGASCGPDDRSTHHPYTCTNGLSIHHQIYHSAEYSNEEDERNEAIKGIKENYQILEKILRNMEGDKVFGADLVSVGVKVELGMKNGKMMAPAGTSNNTNVKKFSRGFHNKKEGETNFVLTGKGRNRS